MDGTEPLLPSISHSPSVPAASINCDLSEGEEHDDEMPSSDRAPLVSKHHTSPLHTRQVPQDSYCLVYIIFFLMGIGSLLPWNFFITAKNYWMYKLNNATDHSDQGDLIEYFESYLAIASTVPSVLSLILNYILVNRISPKTRILSSLCIILVVFVLTTVMVKVDVSTCRTQFFAGTLASVFIVSGASNIFAGSVFGISGHFPMRISQALISGQAMGGTLCAVASIVDLAVAEDVTDSALAYFLTADVFILLCIVTYLLLPRLAYSRHYTLAATCCSPESLTDTGGEVTTAGTTRAVSVPPLRPILRKTWVLGLSVFYVFCVSIVVFPAISSGIQSVQKDSGSPWTTTYFVPLTSFFLYNAADFCGRQTTAWLQVPGPTSKVLPVLVLCRTALIPLIMFCNYQPRSHLHTVLFAHDVYPVVFICLLGVSNGYLGTLPMIYGPKVVPRELAEATGVVMSFFLTLGLAVGSAISVLIVHLI